jgi:hypothetical protein
MNDVSIFRLYLLRAMYLFIAVGLGIMIWPGIVSPPANLSHMGSVVRSVLGTVSLLALLGIRYPLQMLPLLFFELIWKSIWVLAFGLPLWLNDRLDAGTSETLFNCLVGIVLVPIAIPWGYTFQRYFKAAGDRWSNAAAREAVIR